VLFGLTGLLTGCQEPLHPGKPLTVIRISSFERVAGQWEGKPEQVRLPDRGETRGVVLVIKENGVFKFEDENSTDAGLGSGRFTIQDGQLVSDAGDRTTTVILHERGNNHFLDVDVSFKGGDRYTLDMRRAAPGDNPITSPRSPH
jgi:hypothetical protein